MKYSIYDKLFPSETELLEQSILEYANSDPNNVLLEIHFSKKDLQDPETLTRLLKKAMNEKKTKRIIDIILLGLSVVESVALGAVAHSIVIGLISFIPFVTLTAEITVAGDDVLYMIQEKRIEKLKKKCKDLIEKCEKSNDPKAKEIADNCRKTIKAIDDHYKKLYEKKFKENIEYYKKIIRRFVAVAEGKGCIENFRNQDDMKTLCLTYIFNIPMSKLDAGQKKADCWTSCYEVWFGAKKPENNRERETAEQLSKYIPEFKNNGKINTYYAIDDTVFFYSKMANKFYYGDYWMNTLVSGNASYIVKDMASSMEEFFKYQSLYDFKEKILEELKDDIDFIKAADVLLGYYFLSEPEEGKQRKKI